MTEPTTFVTVSLASHDYVKELVRDVGAVAVAGEEAAEMARDLYVLASVIPLQLLG